MSRTGDGPTLPKSMRHKQILDVAADNPDASFGEIAAEVPSATADLVERVLDEYGDPAETTVDSDMSQDEIAADSNGVLSDAETDVGNETSNKDPPSLTELNDTQQETLAAIAEAPTASQREIAEQLGVSAPTVSARVNDIEGFDWADRAAFVDQIFDDESMRSPEKPSISDEPASNTSDETAAGHHDEALAERVATLEDAVEELSALEDLTEQVAALEAEVSSRDSQPDHSATLTEILERIESLEDRVGHRGSVTDDPELAHKIIHACMESEAVSEDEELEIVRSLLDD